MISNVRRRLIFALLSGLVLQTMAPIGAVWAAKELSEEEAREQQAREQAREQMMREQQAVDATIIEFLKNLQQVIKHGDLGDVEALEEILGVEAVVDRVEEKDGERVTVYYFQAPRSKVLAQHKSGFHEYRVTQPLPGKASRENGPAKTRADLKLVFSPSETERGIAIAQMERVFGKRQFHREHQAHLSSYEGFLSEEHVYRWQGRNDIWAMFLFDAETRFLVSVTVYQR